MSLPTLLTFLRASLYKSDEKKLSKLCTNNILLIDFSFQMSSRNVYQVILFIFYLKMKNKMNMIPNDTNIDENYAKDEILMILTMQ